MFYRMYFSGNSLSGNSVQKLYLAGPNEMNYSNYSIVPILCLNCFTLYFYFNSYTSSFKPQLSYISIIIPQFSQPLCPTPLVLKICTLPSNLKTVYFSNYGHLPNLLNADIFVSPVCPLSLPPGLNHYRFSHLLI